MAMHSFDVFPELVQSLCADRGYDFFPTYSGRGMFGTTCPGIVHGESLFTLGIQLAGYIHEALVDIESDEVIHKMLQIAEQAQEDSMGLQRIVYFPGLPRTPFGVV